MPHIVAKPAGYLYIPNLNFWGSYYSHTPLPTLQKFGKTAATVCSALPNSALVVRSVTPAGPETAMLTEFGIFGYPYPLSTDQRIVIVGTQERTYNVFFHATFQCTNVLSAECGKYISMNCSHRVCHCTATSVHKMVDNASNGAFSLTGASPNTVQYGNFG